MKARSLGGKNSGESHKRNGTGLFGMSKESKFKARSLGAKKSIEVQRRNGTGIFGMTSEEHSMAGKIGVKKTYIINKRNGTGACHDKEVIKRNIESQKRDGTGIFGMSKEKRS